MVGLVAITIIQSMRATTLVETNSPVAIKAAGTPKYEIVERDGDYGKDVFWVRLSRKPSSAELIAITREIKSQARKPRAVIWFALPTGDHKINAWASADCDPEVQVEIHGLTEEQATQLMRRPLPNGSSAIVGRWLEDANGGVLWTIYRQGDSLWLEHAGSAQGNGIRREIVEVETIGHRRFQRKEFSRAGDHYVINGRGNLEVRDDRGLFTTANLGR